MLHDICDVLPNDEPFLIRRHAVSEELDALVRHTLVVDYGLPQPIHVSSIPQGRATNFLVRADGRPWLCKVFQERYSVARIQAAARYVDFLHAHGYPLQQFCRTVDGTVVSNLQGRAFVLIPYIEGAIIPTYTVASCDRLVVIGRLCGQIHQLSVSYPQAAELWESLPANWSLEPTLARFERLAPSPGAHAQPELAQQLQVRLTVLRRIGPALVASACQCNLGMIHGDYFADHVVWAREGSWVIDVLGSYYYPGWELMRAFFQSIPPVSTLPDDAVAHLWSAFIAGYRDGRAIGSEELLRSFDLYLLQLLKSPYGLVPDATVAQDAVKREQLLAFGRWRTMTGAALAERRPRLQEIIREG